MTETRTETVVSNQKTRLSERREPKLDVAEVLTHVDGNSVIARTDVQVMCMVREGETVQILEQVKRKQDGWAVGTEATIAVIGAGILGMGLYGVSQNCGKNAEGNSCGLLFPILPTALGGVLTVVGGTATIVDLTKKTGDESNTRRVTKPATEETAVACSDSRRGRHKVTIAFPAGSASAETDDSGIAKLQIPGGTKWGSDGVLEVEVRLDDKPAKRVQLRREGR